MLTNITIDIKDFIPVNKLQNTQSPYGKMFYFYCVSHNLNIYYCIFETFSSHAGHKGDCEATEDPNIAYIETTKLASYKDAMTFVRIDIKFSQQDEAQWLVSQSVL